MTGEQRRRLRREIEILEDTTGSPVSPQDLVNWAREHPESVAYLCFEWDNAEAAERYRLDQARSLIRRVRVEIREEQTVVRAIGYHHDPALAPGRAGYTHIEQIRQSEEASRSVFEGELSRIEASARRARKVGRDLGMDPDAVEERIRAAIDSVLAEEVA